MDKNDWCATPDKVESTRQQFAAIGQPFSLEWLTGRGHEYMRDPQEINERAWRFLEAQRLPVDPVYHTLNIAGRSGQ